MGQLADGEHDVPSEQILSLFSFPYPEVKFGVRTHSDEFNEVHSFE
jgi:hypothetical protein